MKASELISALQAMQEDYGDMEVRGVEGFTLYPLDVQHWLEIAPKPKLGLS